MRGLRARGGGRRRRGRRLHGGLGGVHPGEHRHDDRRSRSTRSSRCSSAPARARLVATRLRLDGVRLSLQRATSPHRGGRARRRSRCSTSGATRSRSATRSASPIPDDVRRVVDALLERIPSERARAASPRHVRPRARERRGRPRAGRSRRSTRRRAAPAAALRARRARATSRPRRCAGCSTASATPTGSMPTPSRRGGRRPDRLHRSQGPGRDPLTRLLLGWSKGQERRKRCRTASTASPR